MIATLLAAALSLPSPVDPAGPETASPRLKLGFSQSGERLGMIAAPDGGTIEVALHSRPFEIHFPTSPAKKPIYMLTFWTDSTIFQSIPIHKRVDADSAEFNYFGWYAYIADEELGSGTLFLNDRGHQGFFDLRLTRSGSDYAAPVATIWREENDQPIEAPVAQWGKPIYAVAWFDTNVNGIVDDDEIERFILKFSD